MAERAAGRQLQRLLRRPALRDARDAERRRARRAHRRLPRRADHADPRPRPAEGPVAGLRPHVRPPGRGLPRARARAGRAGSSPTPAASTRPGSPSGCARSPPGSGCAVQVAHVAGRRPARPRRRARARRRAADRERLPRRLRHRRRARGTAPTSWSPAGSPTPRWWSGPAIARFGWTPTSYDELAGAVVAGHVLECGAQATGGNFSGFAARRPRRSASRSPRSPPTGRAWSPSTTAPAAQVSVDTVTAQLVYEIQSATYLGPDVSTHLDSIALAAGRPRPGADLRRAAARRRRTR